MTDAALASDAAPANPFIPKGAFAEKVTEVQHYTDRLFRFRITRPQSLRFRSGEFVMIGLPNSERPVLRAYSIASPSWDEELEFFSIKVPNGPLTEHLQKIKVGDTIIMKPKATGTLVNDALIQGKRLFCFSTGTGFAQVQQPEGGGPAIHHLTPQELLADPIHRQADVSLESVGGLMQAVQVEEELDTPGDIDIVAIPVGGHGKATRQNQDGEQHRFHGKPRLHPEHPDRLRPFYERGWTSCTPCSRGKARVAPGAFLYSRQAGTFRLLALSQAEC